MIFEEKYKQLNGKQREAVDAIEGPVMVVAGPGTGKTSILTLRIANILKKTDTTPDCILALTFTESGVYSMRKKLADIIGGAAYKVNIYTFHGFCNDIIKNYPEEFPRIIGAQNITDIDQIKILEEIIDNTKLEILKPYGDTYHYVRSIISEINNLKQENISYDDLEKILIKQSNDFDLIPDLYHEKGKYLGEMKGKYKDLEKINEKNKELQKIYIKYEKALTEKRLYDYQDMILEVIKALESNKDLLLRLQEKYQYVLADEHQDANSSQNKILELISGFHENPNIFIVGDEKQAIFRFQGASLENFLYFKKLYPQAILISLTENYRSSQAILDASHSLISKNTSGAELRLELQAKAKQINTPISLYIFDKARNEYRFVAENIAEKIKSSINSSEIAVIYRENKDASLIARALERLGIPFSIESDQELFADNDIAKIILLLKAINDLGASEILAKALFIDFLELSYLDIYKIIAQAKALKISTLEAIHNDKYFSPFYEKISFWGKQAKNSDLLNFFELVIRESGFIKHILQSSESIDKISKLDKLLNLMKELMASHKNYSLADFINYLDVLEKHNIIVKTKGKALAEKSVHLLTAHKAKGLEFDYVYIIKIVDGHWGNKREMRKFKLPISNLDILNYDAIEDERRLFYVALTRARKEVCLSYSKISEEGKALLPAQFIGEIEPKLVSIFETKDLEEKYDGSRAEDFMASKVISQDIKDKEYLKRLFFEQGLSVTALNNYLTCPWQYFFNNLVRLPQALSKHQMYGTAVHQTLKHFFDKYRDEEDLTKKELLDLFEKYLAKQPISQNDFEETLIKGKKSLGGYYDNYKNTWSRSLINEFNIAGVYAELSEVVSGEDKILLKGQLDKIEILNDGTVKVVDYKTRKPLSRNQIEGKTKSGDGNYIRQLIFYKILLDKYENLPAQAGGKYQMQTGELDFIEPDDKDNYKKESFAITPEAEKEVLDLIGKTATNIANLSFWDKKCEDKDCEYCKLRDIMKK
jgi:DNA helicase-2/ATP-dependent DNA helicase PcrA